MLIIRLFILSIFLCCVLYIIFSEPFRVDHKLLYFLRQSDKILKGTNLSHFPDHDFKFTNTILINFAEVVHLNNAIFLKRSNSSCVLCLNNYVIIEYIVARKGAINKMVTIRDTNTVLVNEYIIYLSLISLSSKSSSCTIGYLISHLFVVYNSLMHP
jgi:hypothetical protein